MYSGQFFINYKLSEKKLLSQHHNEMYRLCSSVQLIYVNIQRKPFLALHNAITNLEKRQEEDFATSCHGRPVFTSSGSPCLLLAYMPDLFYTTATGPCHAIIYSSSYLRYIYTCANVYSYQPLKVSLF